MRASSLFRYAACPSSWKREQASPQQPEDESPEAASGTRIHLALAGGKVDLNVDEEAVVEKCWDMMSAFVQDMGQPDEEWIEQPLSIPAEILKLGDLEITGHPDRVLIYYATKTAIVLDWKSGWGDVPPSELNLQLRAYCLMTKMKLGKAIEKVIVVIAKRKSNQPDCTVYEGRQTFIDALNEIRSIAQRAIDADENAELHPSEGACKYCSAQATCPAIRGQIERLTQLAIAPQRWREYPIEDRLQLWDKIKLAKKAIHLIELRFYEDLVEDPEAYGGELYLKKGRSVTTITDPAGVFAASGLTPEAFTACCKVGITALKTAIAKDRGIKGKALDSTFQEIVGPHSEKSEARQSVEARR